MAARAETIASPLRGFMRLICSAIVIGLTVTMVVDAGRSSTLTLPVWFVSTTGCVLVGFLLGRGFGKWRLR